MLILKLAMRNLARHLRRTLLLGFLIAVGMATLFVANAVFSSTNTGLKASFIRSLTGDAAISARTETAFGLFGSEVPIVSDYESIPAIPLFVELAELLRGMDDVAAWTPVVSAAAQMRIGKYAINVPVFGVDPVSYFEVCSDIGIARGDVSALSDGGVFINSALAASAEAYLARSLEIGEPITFSMYSGGSFRIKKGRFAGIHRYVSSSEALDRMVLADPTIVRSIANYTLGYGLRKPAESGDALSEAFDMASLFADASDVESPVEAGLTLQSVEASMADTTERDALVMTDSAAWSFVLVKAAAGRERHIVDALGKAIDAAGLDCRPISWRAAAGMSAQALFAVQSAFYIGLGFIAFGAVLVIMNALVISVLERSAEIGTMRGLGADSSFIRGLFIAESMMLTILSAIAGIIVGVLVSAALSHNGIPVSNPLLVSLFGGSLVRPIPTLGSALGHVLLASVVGALAWIYPVSLAMRVQPIAAMNGN